MNYIPRFSIETHDYGWLICGQGGRVPLDILTTSMGMFPKGVLIATSIPHHYRVSGREDVVMAVAIKENIQSWTAAINQAVAGLPPEERWWKGTEVGASSAAVFAVFCDARWKRSVEYFYPGANVPHDADDFGRCQQLLALFPEWNQRREEIGKAYPDTKWPAIIARWTEIANAAAAEAGAILRAIT